MTSISRFLGLVIPNSSKGRLCDGYHSRGEGADRREVLNVAYGALLGYPITVIRVKGAAHHCNAARGAQRPRVKSGFRDH
jgi:hypothetical protein